ncbi:hypothetical protein D3C75_871790 [compost metagenome]
MIDHLAAEERAQRNDHLEHGHEQRHATFDILGRHDKHPDIGTSRERTEGKAPQCDQHRGTRHAGGEVREQGGADCDHERDQHQGMPHAAVGSKAGEDVAHEAGHAIQQQQ